MQRDKQAVHMEDGQAVDEHIATALRASCFRPAPIVFQHFGVGEQIAMAEHGAFAAARGATGIDHGRQIVRIAWRDGVHIAVLRGALQQAALALIVQGKHILRAGLKRQLASPAKVARAADQNGWFGIA